LAQVIASGLRRAWIDCGVTLTSPANEGALFEDTDPQVLAMRLFPAPLGTEQRKIDGAAYAKTVREHLLQLNRLKPLELEQ